MAGGSELGFRGLVDRVAVLTQAVHAYMAEGRAVHIRSSPQSKGCLRSDAKEPGLVGHGRFQFPKRLIYIHTIQSLYNTRLQVRRPNDITSKWIATPRGLKQGCVLSLFLLSLFLSRLSGPLCHRPAWFQTADIR